MITRLYDNTLDVSLSLRLQLSEFKCKCGKCRATLVNDHFLDCFALLRTKLDLPVILTCGYRCQAHNEEVGGVVLSQHILGVAMDFVYTDEIKKRYSSEQVLDTLNGCGFVYAYFNSAKNFFHADCRQK